MVKQRPFNRQSSTFQFSCFSFTKMKLMLVCSLAFFTFLLIIGDWGGQKPFGGGTQFCLFLSPFWLKLVKIASDWRIFWAGSNCHSVFRGIVAGWKTNDWDKNTLLSLLRNVNLSQFSSFPSYVQNKTIGKTKAQRTQALTTLTNLYILPFLPFLPTLHILHILHLLHILLEYPSRQG